MGTKIVIIFPVVIVEKFLNFCLAVAIIGKWKLIIDVSLFVVSLFMIGMF